MEDFDQSKMSRSELERHYVTHAECERVNGRLALLEHAQRELEKVDKHTADRMNAIGTSVDELVKKTSQLQWMIIGGVLALVIENMGLVEFLKALLKGP